MRTLIIITIVFAVLIIAGTAFKSLDTQADNNAIAATSEEIGTGKVLGIHYYTLKEGVDPKEFERFIVEEWNPAVQEFFPGVRLMFMKGERGAQVDKYICVYEMNSLYVRNFYWPGSVKFSEIGNAIWEKHKNLWEPMGNRMNELVERTEYTDYVEIVKK